ncbi:MAG TPA: MoxR family ATPase [Pseudonocardiaceae bacterium]|jgi:MoxR-like ATPase|nr:MoxR family ATPase [Pseudonocardiaceae bacterium]
MNEHREQAQALRSAPPAWWIYHGTGRPRPGFRLDQHLPAPPPWRTFAGGPVPDEDIPPDDDRESVRRIGPADRQFAVAPEAHELDMINAAIFLRRPLLVTGPPGSGKSTLAYLIARELALGRVLRWHITSQTTMKSSLYGYDAIGRAQAIAAARAAVPAAVEGPADIGRLLADDSLGDFIGLGPLGTAFLPSELPRVLLVDELDKSEMDLPNDLLGIFEDGGFSIPELARVSSRTPELNLFTDDPDRKASIRSGRVLCRAFPIVVMTSNGERDFPPAFLRRCLQLEILPPSQEKLAAMVAAQLGDSQDERQSALIREFVRTSGRDGALPADRLLDALFLATSGRHNPNEASWLRMRDALWRQLTSAV